MNEQTIGAIAGVVAAAGYVGIHAWDRWRQTRKKVETPLHLPMSPMVAFGRLALVAVIAFAVWNWANEGMIWFAVVVAVVCTAYTVWDFQKRLPKKK